MYPKISCVVTVYQHNQAFLVLSIVRPCFNVQLLIIGVFREAIELARGSPHIPRGDPAPESNTSTPCFTASSSCIAAAVLTLGHSYEPYIRDCSRRRTTTITPVDSTHST